MDYESFEQIVKKVKNSQEKVTFIAKSAHLTASNHFRGLFSTVG